MILIYGASGHAHELAQLAQVCGYVIFGYIDDNVSGASISKLQESKSRFPKASVVLGVGSPQIRRYLADKVQSAGFEFFSKLIHPKIELSGSIEIGQGSVIAAGCILTVDTCIGRQTHVNIGCTINHDVWIDDFVTLSPGVHVCGNVKIESDVFVGAGVVIMNGTPQNPIVIGKGAVIGAGACVTRSVPSGETWVGVPAKPIRGYS